MFNPVLCTCSRSIVQSDLEQGHLYRDHDHSLCQQGSGIILSEPVEDPNARQYNAHSKPWSRVISSGVLLQDRRDEHDQRDVQRETHGAPVPVDAEDLVGVGGERGRNETVGNMVSMVYLQEQPYPTSLDIQHRRAIFNGELNEVHGADEDFRDLRRSCDGQQFDTCLTRRVLNTRGHSTRE